MGHVKLGLVERMATKLGIIPKLAETDEIESITDGIKSGDFPLYSFPPQEKWDHWEELDSAAWPLREKRAYTIVPTTCFNCESACGLLAYVDKVRNKVRKFEGNPLHPGSRGRNCAKGPATINQIDDPDRILYPLKRVGKRGEGKWERVSWEDALKDIGGKIAKAFDEDRKENVIYHVGRPGHEGYTNRVLQGWGIDGHNSHTAVCSSGARHGYSLWHKYDRPSPDHANAKVILLVSAHLESGHYFNPHAQRIMEGVMKGAKLVTLDPRLSNTASMSDLWLPVQPGSEAALFLAIARLMIIHRTYSESQFKEWTNWREFMAAEHSELDQTWESFKGVMLEEWEQFTPEFAAKEARIPVEQVHELYEIVIKAQGKLSAHTWRSASIGNLGGWQVSRTLHLLVVMTGSVGVEGGTMPSAWNKFKPDFFDKPPAVPFWNTFNMPDDWSVAQWELSQCLPHIMKEREAKLDVYFTRVFNPVWTYPDGFSW
ncbi:MAG: molybdopterin-dependent oxidoreductase, partial [Planctomycetota bacterium]